jgi:hypothetical protein
LGCILTSFIGVTIDDRCALAFEPNANLPALFESKSRKALMKERDVRSRSSDHDRW